MDVINRDLKKRILEISKKLKLSHIGSCLSQLPILEEIYQKKKAGDFVILDNAHTHLAHLIIRDAAIGDNLESDLVIEDMIKDFGIHCDRKAGCDTSSGSLGHGLGISIGMAIANSDRDIYCIVSDGSMMEGSNWEALRIIEDLYLDGKALVNLHIYANFNGHTAVEKIYSKRIEQRMAFCCPLHMEFRYPEVDEEFAGVAGHYKIIE